MSDETSTPRGRYAQPRRRRHSQKGRRQEDQSSFDAGAETADGPAAGQSFDESEAYDREPFDHEAFADEDVAGFEADAADRYEDQQDYGETDAPAGHDGYDHDYLGREGAASEFPPESEARRDYPEDDDYEDDRYVAPANARSYDDGAYEREPLRDRSLPPPPADAALLAPHDAFGSDYLSTEHHGDEANLIISSIGKSYKRRPVVRDVSLEVRRGEIVGLLGPNGAGKTTCFYMITGLIPADRGSIQLMGNDLTRLPMYQRARMGLSYLPQEVSIFRGMTVEQNIRAILELAEPSPNRREARLDQLLAEFSISRLRNSPAIALSGGERRRVEIARCLAANPHFILLDEPFAGVDPIAVGDIRSLVWQLKDRGIGVLITDHNVRETLEIIDRAYILHDGRVLMEGAPQDVINDENVRRVYLGEGFRI